MTEAAISTFSILVAIILNLIPADVTSFTIREDVEGRETIRLTKQADGGWKMTDGSKGNPVSTIRVDGTKMTVTEDGGKRTVDLSGHLDIDKNTDWEKLEEVGIGGAALKIERKPDGLDLTIRDGNKDGERGELLKVRWEKRGKK